MRHIITLLSVVINFISSVVVDQANALASAAHRNARTTCAANSIAQAERLGLPSWQNVLMAIENQLRTHYDDLVAYATRSTLRMLSTSASLIDVVIVPILAFFILKDGR